MDKNFINEIKEPSKWDLRFIKLCYSISEWSSCIRRKVGAVVVKDKRILTTGYNGAPAGVKSCAERNECLRNIKNIPSGTQQEVCYATHSEQNAIVQAAKMGIPLEGATLYCTTQPCVLCCRVIINSGIKRVVFAEGYPDEFSIELFKEAGMQVDKISLPN